MTTQDALKILTGNNYYPSKDLRYNNKLGFNLSKDEFISLLDCKDLLTESNNPDFEALPLKTFNSKHCFFVNSNYIRQLTDEYMGIMDFDIQTNQSSLILRNFDDVFYSQLYSEIEGTLKIENVPTTRKRIKELIKNNNPADKNDIIIKNMYDALFYIINESPDFTEENLFRLYNILSRNCLSENQKLLTGQLYRHDEVSIDGFDGAPAETIKESMDSLFSFANNKQFQAKYKLLLPYICHYYILYIHPYFDFNGRTARMVSFWLNYILELSYAPIFMSDAINEKKKDYYNALRESRINRNDLTFFLGYILKTAVSYCIVYKNIEEIKAAINAGGDDLSLSEWTYLKKIIVHNPTGYFTQKMFQTYINSEITKVGALKILNSLVKFDILEKGKNRKGESIFRLKDGLLVYSLPGTQ